MTLKEQCDICDNKQCQCRVCRGIDKIKMARCKCGGFDENEEEKCHAFMPIIEASDIIVIEGEKPFKGTLSQFEKFIMGTNANYDCVEAYCIMNKCTFEIVKEKSDEGYS